MDFHRPFHDYPVPSSSPDIMNDPAYETNRRGREREHEEPDTCRICRGEGTEQDQLYYPCKCSGSIKFVHQACLVQWLAHSQKKHCELCKTPFQFTKVYDPDMPDSLPTFLFMKQLLLHAFRKVLRWLRWTLVAFVWLGWLPWSMRAIWRALFWLADGSWSSSDGVQNGEYHGYNMSSISDPIMATSSAEAAQPSLIDGPTQSMFGLSSAEPLLLKLMKKALSTLFFPAMSSSFGYTNSSHVTTTPYKRRPSWLSDVKFLKFLTPSPTINNIIIDTLEGQLITLLVVVSFILVFLIREWVVQQQPLDNIAEGEREAADQLIANNRPADQAEAPEPEPEPEPQRDLPAEDTVPNRDTDIGAEDAPEDRATTLPRSDSEINLPRELLGSDGSPDLRNLIAEGPVTPPIRFNNEGNDGFNFDLPSPQRLHQANQQRPTVNFELLRDLYARANGDYEEMRRLVREEGRYEELSWHVNSLSRHMQWRDGFQRTRDREHASSGLSASTSQLNANAEAIDEAEPALADSSQFPSQSWSQFDPAEADSPMLNLDIRPSSGCLPLDSEAPLEQSFDGQAAEVAEPQGEPRTPSSNGRLESEVGDGISGLGMPVTDNEVIDGLQPSPETSPVVVEPPRPFTRRVLDWFWADVPDEMDQGPQQEEGEGVPDEPVIEIPRFQEGNHVDAPNGDEGNAAAFADLGVDANDLDAIEEADDLEGLLELIGMQGPIFGLLQNAVFCALLISFTVASGIWLPYLTGKIGLVLLVNPVQFILGGPVTAGSALADLVLDSLIGILGYSMYWTTLVCKVALSPLASLVPMLEWTKSITSASLLLIDASTQRLGRVVSTFFVFNETDVPMFSVISHQALKIHEARIATLLHSIFLLSKFVMHDLPLRIASIDGSKILQLAYTTNIGDLLASARSQVYDMGHQIYASVFATPTDWVNWLGISNGTMDYNLAVWGTKDRTIAILLGYLVVSIGGLCYLQTARLISGADRGQRVEGLLAEGLHQAGGVMKVILIIGIEMIVFPLYCGSLLDIALLPLFENATLQSRLDFTSSYPVTSLFVHWFIGTCYMFHFALFVSMCRKVMRSGVLYFIRDPDDPTFHPVRDVLERNITTQLRKIAFSALVYGALVIVCLGGVVWGLYYGFDGVLPAHWSSRDPVLEFPIDLLFYNFGIPLAIQALKPSEALHSLYSWWFRKCARFLRLSDFFFGERHLDEESNGTYQAWWSSLVGSKGQRSHSDAKHPDSRRSGKFVRAPASDQVRIPKGSPVFLEVTETNERVDGKPDSDQGLHGRQNNMFTRVYIPPFFRTRIAAFLFLIWAFAAATGVGTTIVPLLIGRKVMSSYVLSGPVNDVYALSVGMGVVCAAACVLVSCRAGFTMVKNHLGSYLRSPGEAFQAIANVLVNGLRILYTATAFLIFLPSVFALAIELYLLIPIHTYLDREKAPIIHFVQDWTLGVLYVQLAARLVLWRPRSRPAAALNGVFRDGWLKPNVKLATRALLLPITLLATIAVTLPLFFGFVFNATVALPSPELHTKVYRYAYPFTLLICLEIWLSYLLYYRVENWKVSIRDEFYLVGERLHNFREKRAREVGVPRRVITG
ncbi:hypothetical protein BJX61DRAFT_86077 [Aspergillus egyptiacus]|nr:hypothetical protein BJX61DRAFT_86077 [Aspergillus egyptiacus]